MKEDELRILEEVGKVSYAAIAKAKSLIKPGARILDVAQAVEGFVRESGFGFAFPLNLSIGSQAAHSTPSFEDDRSFGAGDVVKVDFGAAKDGLYGDCALTVDLSGRYGKLVEAVERALESAISAAKPGISTGELGGVIAKEIESAGFKPIRNLGGHLVERRNLHAGFFIPNHDDGSTDVLEEGMVIAMEPFATDGTGLVRDGDDCEIFSYANDAAVRQQNARAILNEVKEKYADSPFAARWLSPVVPSRFSLYSGIQELVRAGALELHPVLVEQAGGTVAQAEAMMLVEKDGCKVLTK